MTDYRTLDDVTIEYFTQHPDEIEEFKGLWDFMGFGLMRDT